MEKYLDILTLNKKEIKMKKITLLIGLLSILSVNANAFSYSTPNVFGGYNYYDNGSFGYSTPNVFGGYNYHGSMFN